jgi:hypothetical protein
MYYIDDCRYLGLTQQKLRSVVEKLLAFVILAAASGVPSAQGRLFDSARRFASGLLRSE